jgi:hypothetical protein
VVRGREVRERVGAGIERWDAIRFVTLTLRADASSLADRWGKLWRSFATLRTAACWRDNVAGGIAIPEVTVGKHGQWHVHLHVLVHGRFIPQAQLKAAWHAATGDSFVVGIEIVHSRKDAAMYVAKYVGKGAAVHTWDPDRIREYAETLAGKRLLRVYGDAKLPKLDEDDEEDVPSPSEHLCGVAALHRAELAGLEPVRHACDIIASLGRTHALVLDREPAPKLASPAAATLMAPTAHDYVWARRCCEIVEAAFPALPTVAELENARRGAYGMEAPPPPPRYSQMVMDVLWDRCRV